MAPKKRRRYYNNNNTYIFYSAIPRWASSTCLFIIIIIIIISSSNTPHCWLYDLLTFCHFTLAHSRNSAWSTRSLQPLSVCWRRWTDGVWHPHLSSFCSLRCWASLSKMVVHAVVYVYLLLLGFQSTPKLTRRSFRRWRIFTANCERSTYSCCGP